VGEEALSVRLMSMVWTLDLDHPEQSVLLAFADHAHDDGRAFPGLRYVAWKTGYSHRQVRRIVDKLEDNGILVVEREPRRGRATVYQLVLSRAKPKAAYSGWGDILSPQVPVDNSDGGTSEPNGGTSTTSWGDIAASPLTSEPSNQGPISEKQEVPTPITEWNRRRRKKSEAS
jgi:hypothetical protein